jgi:hypothetical protein
VGVEEGGRSQVRDAAWEVQLVQMVQRQIEAEDRRGRLGLQ